MSFAFCITATDARAQTAADSAAIRQAALDYIEGWYTGNAERMKRAVHPKLAKRIVVTHPETGKSMLKHMGASALIKHTKEGYGTRVPKDQRLKAVTILDIFEGAASVKINATRWIDYLHLAKWNGEWKIINVLWERKPESQAR